MCRINIVKCLLLFVFLTPITQVESSNATVLALRLRKTDGKFYYTEEGQIIVEEGLTVDLQVIGLGLKNDTVIKLTTAKKEKGTKCKDHGSTPAVETAELTLQSGGSLVLNAKNTLYSSRESTYYVCVKVNEEFVHQGYGI